MTITGNCTQHKCIADWEGGRGWEGNDQLPHLFHQLVQSNSFAGKYQLLFLTLPMALDDIPNKGQQISGQTGIQGYTLALDAG